MDTQIITALAGVATTVITVLGGYLVKYVNQLFTANQVAATKEEIASAKEFAYDAVNNIEEIAPGLAISGKQKFNKAIEAAKGLADKLNIDLTDEQWQTITNSMLKQARTEWDSAQGKAEDVPVAPEVVATPMIAPDAVTPPADANTPVPVPSTLQPILDTAKQAYNQVLTDSAQALTGQVK